MLKPDLSTVEGLEAWESAGDRKIDDNECLGSIDDLILRPTQPNQPCSAVLSKLDKE